MQSEKEINELAKKYLVYSTAKSAVQKQREINRTTKLEITYIVINEWLDVTIRTIRILKEGTSELSFKKETDGISISYKQNGWQREHSIKRKEIVKEAERTIKKIGEKIAV
ncbi:hypothetical protein MKX54_10870 [Alkalihalobacillus sp. FSL R5-0424]